MKSILTRTTSYGLIGAFFLTVLLLAVPPAAAQTDKPMTVDVTTTVALDQIGLLDGRLLPDTGLAVVDVQTIVTVPPTTACILQITVEWKKNTVPGYSNVYFNPTSKSQNYKSEAVPGQGSTGGPVTGSTGQTLPPFTTKMYITINRNAPAFETPNYEIVATVTAGKLQDTSSCNITGASKTGTAAVQNGYLPLSLVNPSSLFVKSGQNKKVVFPVEVSNLGNGPTKVTIELTPQNTKKTLESMNAGAELRLPTGAGKTTPQKISRNIEVQTPHSNGYTNSIYSFTAKFTSKYDGQASGTLSEDVSSVLFTVQVQGVYVPGFDPSSAIAALGIGLGILVYRRR